MDAEQQNRKAIGLLEKLTAEFARVPKYSYLLAASHNNLVSQLRLQGKLREAEQQCRKALTLGETLAAAFPAVPEYRNELAHSHTSLGILLMNLANYPEAEQYHHKALALNERLAANFPAVSQYQIDLGGNYCNLGLLIRDSGKVNQSLEWFAKAIHTLNVVYKQAPQLALAKRFLRNSYQGRATAYYSLQRYAEASEDWDNAIRLSPEAEQPLLRTNRACSLVRTGQVAEAIADIVELTKTSDRNARLGYNLACVYSLASGKIKDKKREYAARAMELLHQSVKAGLKDVAHMKKDTALDSLRDREDFKKLMQQLEKKSADGKEK